MSSKKRRTTNDIINIKPTGTNLIIQGQIIEEPDNTYGRSQTITVRATGLDGKEFIQSIPRTWIVN